MIVEFNYKLPESLVPLMNQEIMDFNDEYILGYVDQADAGNLKHCSMFMVTQLETYDKLSINKNPLAIVAKNETQALDIYFRATNNTDGAIFCNITENCSGIKVQPTGKQMK